GESKNFLLFYYKIIPFSTRFFIESNIILYNYGTIFPITVLGFYCNQLHTIFYTLKNNGIMKSIEVRLPQDVDKSFVVFKEKGPYFPCPWHYHPEYELVLVLKSTGRRMVGDHIGYFQEGDLVCLGPYLPHVWVNDSIYITGKAPLEADAIVIHFKEDFLGRDFLKIPEMDQLRSFLRLSNRGMSFFGSTKEQINALMMGMVNM